ncbi:hypothetical protein L218DRAFT_968070 [Marasmius fiardii PR-910]|nr:hypothetical protein L218DRAFT_968070 [Marasmius fiardii PR-910]
MPSLHAKARNDDSKNIALLDSEFEGESLSGRNSHTIFLPSSTHGQLSSWTFLFPVVISIILVAIALIGPSVYAIPMNTWIPTLIIVQRLISAAIYVDTLTFTIGEPHTLPALSIRPLFRHLSSVRKLKNNRASAMLGLTTFILGIAALIGAIVSFSSLYGGGTHNRKVCWMTAKDMPNGVRFEYGRDCWVDQTIWYQGVLQGTQGLVLLGSLVRPFLQVREDPRTGFAPEF